MQVDKIFESVVGGAVIFAVYILLKLIFNFIEKSRGKNGNKSRDDKVEKFDADVSELTRKIGDLSKKIEDLTEEQRTSRKLLNNMLEITERLTLNVLFFGRYLKSLRKREKD